MMLVLSEPTDNLVARNKDDRLNIHHKPFQKKACLCIKLEQTLKFNLTICPHAKATS